MVVFFSRFIDFLKILLFEISKIVQVENLSEFKNKEKLNFFEENDIKLLAEFVLSYTKLFPFTIVLKFLKQHETSGPFCDFRCYQEPLE